MINAEVERMRTVTLGNTGIVTPQNAFGALPVQRVEKAAAVRLLRRAHEGGMTFFDTARAYSDSEEKLGAAFAGMRDRIFIASKTMASTPEKFWEDLHTSQDPGHRLSGYLPAPLRAPVLRPRGRHRYV